MHYPYNLEDAALQMLAEEIFSFVVENIGHESDKEIILSIRGIIKRKDNGE